MLLVASSRICPPCSRAVAVGLSGSKEKDVYVTRLRLLLDWQICHHDMVLLTSGSQSSGGA